MNIAHESKSNKTPLYLIGELIGVPNTVMDSALHELKDRIDKDPKLAYLWCKVVYNYLKMLKIGSNLYPRSEPIFPNTRPDAILTYRVFILIHIVLF